MSNLIGKLESTATMIYTAITFAPVQGFIEKSRKLRDLYGSSYILSYLSKAICDAVPEELLISPANINITRGTPNVILVKGNFPKEEAKQIFDQAWFRVLEVCRTWIEENLEYEWKWNESTKSYEQLSLKWNYTWGREWKLWSSHAWEFFWAQSGTIETTKDALFAKKRSRAWTAINWIGESSTLSGADALAIPSAGIFHPQQGSYKAHEAESKAFSAQLSAALGEAFIAHIEKTLKDSKTVRDKLIQRYGIEFIRFVETKLSGSHNKPLRISKAKVYGEAILDPRELLSIPELAKRLITLEAIAELLDIVVEEIPPSYRNLERIPEKSEDRRWTGWFLGDGDKASEYLKNKSDDEYREFSKQMLTWGESHLKPNIDQTGVGRVIYAGGDDFLGSFYHLPDEPILHPQECLNWFYKFKSNDPNNPNVLWNKHQLPITVSVGFIWAAPNVPQRDILQHCREAEQSAKSSGRDRIAIRILFNGGNTLEWTCPWWFFQVFTDYRDRNKKTGTDANWNHIFEDVAILEARHAFRDNTNVALSLFELYFGEERASILRDDSQQWNRDEQAGILGDGDRFPDDADKQKALNAWIVNLAKVGFHLHREKPENLDSPLSEAA